MTHPTVRESTMKALVQDQYGSADVLEIREIDTPNVADDGVLVHVRAASANPLDWHFMRADPFFMRFVGGLRRPKQPVRGVDVSGEIHEVGRNVSNFEPGDEVFGFCDGAFAQYVSGGATNFVPRPANINAEQAAAVPTAAITALQGLRDLGRVEAGQRVLIIGASGGVGTFAVQIAKALGADVTGVCSTRNVDLVRSIGADHVIDYSQQNIADLETRYDVVFQLAGTASPRRLRRLLNPKGTLVLSSGMGRFSGIGRVVSAMLMNPFVSQRLVTWVANESHEDLRVLAEMIESRAVTPVIDRTYDLDDAAEAIRYVEQGHTRGKVVVRV